jgi:hypothetical protein
MASECGQAERRVAIESLLPDVGFLRVQYLDLYFFYILMIFLKLYQTNLILFCSLMRLVLSLQILIPWHLGIILMKSLGK